MVPYDPLMKVTAFASLTTIDISVSPVMSTARAALRALPIACGSRPALNLAKMPIEPFLPFFS